MSTSGNEILKFSIRAARAEDVPAITAIYNDAVLTTVATFDTEPRSLEDRQSWFSHHDDQFPVIVGVSHGGLRAGGGQDVQEPTAVSHGGQDDGSSAGQVIGWASLSRWSDKKAYDCTAELSLYIAADARGHGVGTALFLEILRLASTNGLHSVISRITEGNEISIRLHEKYGFSRVGVLKEVGRKFGRLLDVIILQKILGSGPV